jgi:hypothetical protein
MMMRFASNLLPGCLGGDEGSLANLGVIDATQHKQLKQFCSKLQNVTIMSLLARLCLRGYIIPAPRLLFRTHATKSVLRLPPLSVQLQCRKMSTPPPQIKTRSEKPVGLHNSLGTINDPTTNSTISMERYHALSDTTMDALLESLELFLDDLGNPTYEVEYHVRPPGHRLRI